MKKSNKALAVIGLWLSSIAFGAIVSAMYVAKSKDAEIKQLQHDLQEIVEASCE